MQDFLESLISEHGLDSVADRILSAVAPAMALIKQPRRDDFLGTSRLGGLPDVPPGFAWPRREGGPLALLAQINCREAAPSDEDHLLLDSGILHFFYDLQKQPWGFDPKDKDRPW
jgi:uncharacterized protein YwqG